MSQIRNLLATRTLIASYFIAIAMLCAQVAILANDPDKQIFLNSLPIAIVVFSLGAAITPYSIRKKFVGSKNLYLSVLVAAFALALFNSLYLSGGDIASAGLVFFVIGGLLVMSFLTRLSASLYSISYAINPHRKPILYAYYIFIAIYIAYFINAANKDFISNFSLIDTLGNLIGFGSDDTNSNIAHALLTVLIPWVLFSFVMPVLTLICDNKYARIFFIVAGLANTKYLYENGVDLGAFAAPLNYALIASPFVFHFLANANWEFRGRNSESDTGFWNEFGSIYSQRPYCTFGARDDD